MAAGGKSAVTVAVARAARGLRGKMSRWGEDPAPEKPRNGILPNGKNRPPNWIPNDQGLPRDPPCPVQCLGVEGEIKHLIDSDGQFRSWTKSDFNQAGISDLFAAMPNYPKWAWPRHGRPFKLITDDGEKQIFPIESFKADDVRDALFLACSRAGQFSPTDKLRGRGMWLDVAGRPVYHAGEELWQYDDDKEQFIMLPTGLHEKFLYARLPALPMPWVEPIKPEQNPASTLLKGYRKWTWKRPNVDPLLLLGWNGVAYAGAALKWRPAALLLGDRETGKSTLQKAQNELFGEALFHASDTTAAGIYNSMRQDARPIAVDELEPGDDQRKVDNVVHLMRQSSSGAIGRRSTAEGQARQFQMSSAFLFSAINNPVNSAQDLSRLAVLRLMPLPKPEQNPASTQQQRIKEETPLAIDADTCGPMVLGLLMRNWHRLPAALDFYKRALAKGGHSNRGRDTYGTLLAFADLLLGPDLADALDVPISITLEGQENSAALAYWAEQLAADSLPEIEGALPNWRKCLETLLTVPVQQIHRGGSRPTVGRMLDDLIAGDGGYSYADAVKDLGDIGLGLKSATEILTDHANKKRRGDQKNDIKPDPNYMIEDARRDLGLLETDGYLLAIPNTHPNVKAMFRDTDWANGSWQDALRQCPIAGVMLTDPRINRVRIAGVQQRCTLVVLSRFEKSPEK